ncbi:Alpha/Beta hydrolase protein, partial [Mrakia frigida]|uniref:alpha/beta hydrolase n=1 Tax=Mrakia frigida TaxID=29902 RepID=UPI003FCC158E
WFARAHFWLTLAGGLYVAFVVSLTIPVVQRNAIFMHNIRYPFSANFNTPERYGLAPFKARNLHLETSDGETIGAWHLLSVDVSSRPRFQPSLAVTYDAALLDRPTVIFLHGNAGNRAMPLRIHLMSSLSSTLNVNVLTIDYRGFGDSTGTPSEPGLIADARAAWDWVLERNGGDTSKIALVGQSLGTGVGTGLVGQLAAEGTHPPILALLSPYSSLPTLLQTYSLFRSLPILSPLRALPYAQHYLTSPTVLKTQFNTLQTLLSLPSTSSSTKVILVHAKDDGEIPHLHSNRMFAALLAQELGLEETPMRAEGLSIEAIEQHRLALAERGRQEAKVVREQKVEGWGVVKRFRKKDGEVVWVETAKGGHDFVGGSEGVVSLIGSVWEGAGKEEKKGWKVFGA